MGHAGATDKQGAGSFQLLVLPTPQEDIAGEW